MHDVIVVGGSYAGMAATLQLVRARRAVLIIDGGKRRNRFSTHSRGFLGQDGVDPAKIAADARVQLRAYPALAWIDGVAVSASGNKDHFSVTLDNGDIHTARRLLFAVGVSDELPDLNGLKERWGKSVFHCPYCHGYELNQGRIGIIATGPMSVHQARLLTEWGQVTLFVDGRLSLEPETRHELTQHGVAIEEAHIDRLAGNADVILTDGRHFSFEGLFIAPRCSPSSPLAEDLGCEQMDTVLGTQIWTTDTKETSIPGAFACGDAARVPHSLSLAVGDGAWAGAQLHRSLVWPNS